VEKTVYSIAGKEVRKIELDDTVFGLPVNDDVIYYAINNELANKRVGTASTKDRSEVHGSNAKPYNQKGTGRARRGDKKSPLLRGGGVIFGPRPRDFSYTIPKKMKRLAMKSILSQKAQENRLIVVEDFTVESGKTKDLRTILDRFVKNAETGVQERTVIILNGVPHAKILADGTADPAREAQLAKINLVKRAGGNLHTVHFLSHNNLRAHDLFYGRKVILFESAVKGLSDFYAAEEKLEVVNA
jgi:large subunit ribosomal protein L4